MKSSALIPILLCQTIFPVSFCSSGKQRIPGWQNSIEFTVENKVPGADLLIFGNETTKTCIYKSLLKNNFRLASTYGYIIGNSTPIFTGYKLEIPEKTHCWRHTEGYLMRKISFVIHIGNESFRIRYQTLAFDNHKRTCLLESSRKSSTPAKYLSVVSEVLSCGENHKGRTVTRVEIHVGFYPGYLSVPSAIVEDFDVFATWVKFVNWLQDDISITFKSQHCFKPGDFETATTIRRKIKDGPKWLVAYPRRCDTTRASSLSFYIKRMNAQNPNQWSMATVSVTYDGPRNRSCRVTSGCAARIDGKALCFHSKIIVCGDPQYNNFDFLEIGIKY